MRGGKSRNSGAGAEDETLQVVTFFIGSGEYAFPIEVITEVVRPLKITRLPKMPDFIEGVVNLRGVIIPVVDLRTRFELGTENDPRKMRMIITRGAVQGPGAVSPGLLGFVVDRAEEVIRIPKSSIEPAPPAATGENIDFVTGMGKIADRLIILLDIARVLSKQERTALAEAEVAKEGNAEK